MQPVTTSRRHCPSVLSRAISRMVSMDSCLAESMNAQVLTTRTSADSASRVSSCPASWARPSMTFESTRFLGQPRETRPIFISDLKLQIADLRFRISHGLRTLRIQAIQHAGIRDRFTDVLESANPRDDSFDAHPEAAVRHG